VTRYWTALTLPLLLLCAPNVVGETRPSAASATLPPPGRYVCVRAGGPITIDGKPTEAAWRAVAVADLSHWIGHSEAPSQKTTARLLWDDENLYVAVECEDRDIFATKATRDAFLWEDFEVAEVYLDSTGEGRNYKEFEVNPLNAVIDLNTPDEKSVGNVAHNLLWNAAGLRTAVHVEGTLDRRDDQDTRWTVEMAIPFAALAPTKPRAGDSWRLNLYRYDNSPFGDEKFRLSAWSAVRTWPHEPDRFGRLVFASKGRNE